MSESCSQCGQLLPVVTKKAVETPKGFEVRSGMRGLEITRIWRDWKQIVPLGIFCAFWDGFLIVWYSLALFSGGKAPLMALLFPLIHVAVGVGLTYFLAALLVNETWITVTSEAVEVKHGPLPWAGNKQVGRAGIEQLYVEEKISSNKNGVSRQYDVFVSEKATGDRIRLVGGLQTPEQARFVEQEVERWLGIRDKAVPGEYR